MQTLTRSTKADARQRGGALLISLIVVMALSGIAVAVFSLNLAQKKEISSASNNMRALYTAETGISDCLLAVATSVKTGNDVPTELGTLDQPRSVKGGRYWCTIADNGDGTYTATSTGRSNLATRTLEAVLAETGGGIFDHVVFAGNDSGDPDYTLKFGGAGGQGDEVDGNIYANGDIVIEDDASVVGDIAASGTITGGAGTEGVTRPTVDIAGMNYDINNDVDVASLFATATWQANDLGGSAWEMPEDSPAHIFRKNPDDRTDEISGTPKDDYFLEDPYMPVKDWTDPITGKEGHSISLSGLMGRPGPSGNDKVYFIDGNLWIHNHPFGRLRLYNTDPGGAKVTFVVKGNVYFSDDVFINDHDEDGVAFIAIKDDLEPDSGNIYLGDPIYGTLERMEAFTYAENDFIDYNLDESGSAIVDVVGNMTAGNHVAIQRDFLDDDGNVQHSRMSTTFDDRLSTGALTLPGLPKFNEGVGGYEVLMWREVATLDEEL